MVVRISKSLEKTSPEDPLGDIIALWSKFALTVPCDAISGDQFQWCVPATLVFVMGIHFNNSAYFFLSIKREDSYYIGPQEMVRSSKWL